MSSRNIRDKKKDPREESEEELMSDNESDLEVESFARPGRRANNQAATPGESTEIGREESREVETLKKSKVSGSLILLAEIEVACVPIPHSSMSELTGMSNTQKDKKNHKDDKNKADEDKRKGTPKVPKVSYSRLRARCSLHTGDSIY